MLFYYLYGVIYVIYVFLFFGYRCWFIELLVEVMLVVVLCDGEVVYFFEWLMSWYVLCYV